HPARQGLRRARHTRRPDPPQRDARLRGRGALDPLGRPAGPVGGRAEEMKLTSASFHDGSPIPAEFAFCAPDAKTHATLSRNRNPQLSWSGAPAGTKSFAIVCHDPDVPSKADDVNQEGRTVPRSLARIDFFHWAIVDLPASLTGVQAGEFS